MSFEKILREENRKLGQTVKVIGRAETRAAQLTVMDLLYTTEDYAQLRKLVRNVNEKN